MIPAAEHRDSELQTREMWVKVAAGGLSSTIGAAHFRDALSRGNGLRQTRVGKVKVKQKCLQPALYQKKTAKRLPVL